MDSQFLSNLAAQVLLGLMNGSFYAILSLGVAIIFGMLHVINFVHGAVYMLGAMGAWLALTYFGMNYWWALLLVPLGLAALGALFERTLLRHLYSLDPLYGLLLTFGAAVTIEGGLLRWLGSIGKRYPIPDSLTGAIDLGFMFFPIYRLWVIGASLVLCVGLWLLIDRTKVGAYLRAATEKPDLLQVFGVNVPLMMTATYALGTAIAGVAGVLAAPIYQINPLMGQNLLIIAFAVVIIGGMGSMLGAIIIGYVLGIVEGITKFLYPEASNLAIFVLMGLVLILRPTGLFSKE